MQASGIGYLPSHYISTGDADRSEPHNPTFQSEAQDSIRNSKSKVAHLYF